MEEAMCAGEGRGNWGEKLVRGAMFFIFEVWLATVDIGLVMGNFFQGQVC